VQVILPLSLVAIEAKLIDLGIAQVRDVICVQFVTGRTPFLDRSV
jgi:hypothetical protein